MAEFQSNAFIWHSVVRDYELDLQGRVNNAVYLNYCEHTRHQHAKQLGFDFSELHEQGFDLVLFKANVEYKHSLHSGDAFYVTSNIEKVSALRFKFTNEIYLKADDKLVAVAYNFVTCVNNKTNKPCMPDFIKEKLLTAVK